jgi:hypothetical protein
VVDVLPIVDRAIAAVVVAAGGDAAVAVAGINQVRSCALTRLRQGWQYSRAADLYTEPWREDAVIGRIAERLPAELHPQREAPLAGTAAALAAELGHGVRLAVRQLGEGGSPPARKPAATRPRRCPPRPARRHRWPPN